uniref:Transmembrane protein 161B n=1 Tax=Timema shepardi TaxID=629360 RepID=A0A7R9FVD2_TIMSH|nr:unnamed protein product [Timema shepardi]
MDVLNDFEVPEKPIIPQEEGTSCGDGNKFDETVDIINVDLMKRLKRLQEHVIELRKELNIEKTLWQNEVEEYDEIQKHLDEHRSKGNLHLGLPYETNWNLYETANTDKDLSAKELAIIEYEKKLERYQEALALAQSEKRLQIRRQIAANAYKIKLLEVEKMCNTELERVRQSFTSLESLNKIASDWNLDNSEIGGSKYAPMISEDFGIGHEALLGTQLVITLVMVSVIQKLGPHYSLARWLLCSTGLIRYLYPTDTELKTLAGVPKDSGKSKNKKGGKHIENGRTTETFHIPRSLDIQLETAKVNVLDVIHLRFYTEYQWLLDFSLYSTVVYLLTEILLSLTMQYFKSEESVGERSTVIVTCFSYLLVAMMVLIVDEQKLEIGLDRAYDSFNKSAAAFLETQGLDSKGPASKLVLKFFLALWCALIGALFTFPGLRMAKMHWDCLSENNALKLLLNMSFASPFVAVLLWIKPVARDYLTSRVFTGMTGPLMSDSAFESMRLLFVVAAVVLRLALMPVYLQAYLNMAYYRLEEQKKEAGRITNIELQKKIAAVFYYLCVVTLQYVAPLLLCLYFTFIFKTLGGYSWLGMFKEVPEYSFGAEQTPGRSPLVENGSIQDTAQQFSLALDSLKQIFTADVMRGVFGFATWWSCFAWFASSSLGMVYQSYFGHHS